MSDPIRLKLNFEKKSKVISVGKDILFSDFLQQIRQLEDSRLDQLLETNSLVIEHDYPKKKIDVLLSLDLTLEAVGIKNGQQIWLLDPNISSNTNAPSSANQNDDVTVEPKNSTAQVKDTTTKKRKSNDNDNGNVATLSDLHKKSKQSESTSKNHKENGKQKQEKLYYTKIKTGGHYVLRQMADDNSCLFHAISYCLFGDANHEISLRQIITEEILSDPTKYNAVYLGKEVNQYITWIAQENSWGGAIELEIFANHFNVEINSIDVKSGRIDRFTPSRTNGNKDDQNFLVIYYSGIHFDAFVYNEKQSESYLRVQAGDVGTFVKGSELGDEVMASAESLRNQLKSSGYVTDMGTIHVLCNQCNEILTGEKALVKHMQQTKHTDFQEVR